MVTWYSRYTEAGPLLDPQRPVSGTLRDRQSLRDLPALQTIHPPILTPAWLGLMTSSQHPQSGFPDPHFQLPLPAGLPAPGCYKKWHLLSSFSAWIPALPWRLLGINLGPLLSTRTRHLRWSVCSTPSEPPLTVGTGICEPAWSQLLPSTAVPQPGPLLSADPAFTCSRDQTVAAWRGQRSPPECGQPPSVLPL